MHVMKSRTSSMIWIETRNSADSQFSRFSETSVNLDAAFSFDHQLMNSKIYQIAQRSHIRKALAAEKSQETTVNNKQIPMQSFYNDDSNAANTSHSTDTHTVRGSSQSNSAVTTGSIDNVSFTENIWTGDVSEPDSETTRQIESPSPPTIPDNSDQEITQYSPTSLDTTQLDKLPPTAMTVEPETPAIQVFPPSPRRASTPPSMLSEFAPSAKIFKAFRVSMGDPCSKVLPAALKQYSIQADWRQYSLYIVYGGQERCLGLDEKLSILFKQLNREGRRPVFMLRRLLPPSEE